MTLLWHLTVALTRLRCRVLGRHSLRVWRSGRYEVRWCRACYASRVVEAARW